MSMDKDSSWEVQNVVLETQALVAYSVLKMKFTIVPISGAHYQRYATCLTQY